MILGNWTNVGNSCVWKRGIDGNYACLIENYTSSLIDVGCCLRARWLVELSVVNVIFNNELFEYVLSVTANIFLSKN